MNAIRVLLVDDHELVRAGIRALLVKIEGVEGVGEAADGRYALELIDAQRPDVVLMDIVMPGLNGLEATVQVRQRHAQARVLILSMNAAPEYVVRALKAGASGYLLKNVAVDELATAVKAVARGETYLCSRVSKVVVEEYLRGTGTPASSLDQLSPRQREILQLIAEGSTSKEIAQRLGISISTVETHRGHLMSALDLHDIASLVRYAVRVGLVSVEV